MWAHKPLVSALPAAPRGLNYCFIPVCLGNILVACSCLLLEGWCLSSSLDFPDLPLHFVRRLQSRLQSSALDTQFPYIVYHFHGCQYPFSGEAHQKLSLSQAAACSRCGHTSVGCTHAQPQLGSKGWQTPEMAAEVLGQILEQCLLWTEEAFVLHVLRLGKRKHVKDPNTWRCHCLFCFLGRFFFFNLYVCMVWGQNKLYFYYLVPATMTGILSVCSVTALSINLLRLWLSNLLGPEDGYCLINRSILQ